MNYQETLTYLYESVPMFQQIGSSAYKEGLDNTYALDEYFGHPHRKFKTMWQVPMGKVPARTRWLRYFKAPGTRPDYILHRTW